MHITQRFMSQIFHSEIVYLLLLILDTNLQFQCYFNSNYEELKSPLNCLVGDMFCN